MVKPSRGRGGGKGRGAGRGRGNASTVSGAESKGTPSKQENEPNQEKTLEVAKQLLFLASSPPLETPRILTRLAKEEQNLKRKTQEGLKTHDSMPMPKEFGECDMEQYNLYLKGSKEHEDFSSGSKKKETGTKSEEVVSMTASHDSEETNKQDPDLDLKALKEREESASDNDKKETGTNSEEDLSMSSSQETGESNEQELNLALREHQGISAYTEGERARSKIKENESSLMLLGSKDEDQKKFDLETSHVQQDSTKSQFQVDDETKFSVQDSNLDAHKEGIQNLNINVLTAKPDSTSEKQKLSESKTEQTINVVKKLNLTFEPDAIGIKKVVMDDEKKEYFVARKNKITFNIGDSNVKLSFDDNTISIFAEKGSIQCSKFENEVLFVIKASATKPEPTKESSNTTETSRIKGKETVKDLAIPSATGITKQDPPEEQSEECGAVKNVKTSTLKEGSTLVPISEVQKMLRSRTDIFLSTLIALCSNYENEFLECLKDGTSK